MTLPFLLALPSHYDPEGLWSNVGLWALIAAVFLAAQFAAQRLAGIPHGKGMVSAFAGLYAVFGLLGFISAEHYRFPQAMTDFVLLYLVFYFAALAAHIARPVGRAVLAALVIALSLPTIIQAVHLLTFGFPIGPDGYRAILQSNPGEALEFVGRFPSAGAVAAAAAALIVAVASALGARPPRLPREALAWGGIYALPAVAILSGNSALVTPRAEGFAQAVDYAVEIMQYRVVREARRAHGPGVAIAQEGPLAGQAQTYVFVIGESLTRNHMSLYGYWRETTPALVRLRSEMAVFNDVVSPHSHTDQSLELVLTLANHQNGLRFTDPANYSLIELLRAAGFSTWWISNQNSFGPWDNKVSVLGSGAEHVHFTSTRSGAMVVGPYDEALLEPFAAALRDPAPRKAIFLHFLGNHWEYAKRYPPQMAAFNKLPTAAEIGALSSVHARPDLINEYDDAVRYHDQLAARVIEMVRATDRPAAVTLFSDHGESVYRLKGHYWREFTRDHVEVPLVLWFSPQYAKVAGEVVQRARANADQPFALEDFTHLVGDLAGLRSTAFEPQRSPLSAAYRVPPARTLFEGELIYEQADEPALNARRTLRRVEALHPGLRGALWAHRVDTLAKMMEVGKLFAGVEIDVLYDPEARALMVNHPPEPVSGLTLDAMLGYANRLNPRLAFWLDLKNLSEANGKRVLEELNGLEARHAFRARALVETDHTGPAAAALRAAGYRSSYYLPTKLVTQNADVAGGPAFSCYGADEMKRAVLARRFAAVSYDWRGRQWVERCLGSFVRARGLQSYSWDLEAVASDARADRTLDEERLRRYAAMTAVLLAYRSLFDDWR